MVVSSACWDMHLLGSANTLLRWHRPFPLVLGSTRHALQRGLSKERMFQSCDISICYSNIVCCGTDSLLCFDSIWMNKYLIVKSPGRVCLSDGWSVSIPDPAILSTVRTHWNAWRSFHSITHIVPVESIKGGAGMWKQKKYPSKHFSENEEGRRAGSPSDGLLQLLLGNQRGNGPSFH